MLQSSIAENIFCTFCYRWPGILEFSPVIIAFRNISLNESLITPKLLPVIENLLHTYLWPAFDLCLAQYLQFASHIVLVQERIIICGQDKYTKLRFFVTYTILRQTSETRTFKVKKKMCLKLALADFRCTVLHKLKPLLYDFTHQTTA